MLAIRVGVGFLIKCGETDYMVSESRSDKPYEVFFVRKSSAVKVHKEMFKDDPELRKEFQVVKCERDEDL